MDERRRSERQRSLLRGRVYFNNGRCSLDCLIRDISYEGARIVFSDPVSIPDVIRLAIPKQNRMMDATRAVAPWPYNWGRLHSTCARCSSCRRRFPRPLKTAPRIDVCGQAYV